MNIENPDFYCDISDYHENIERRVTEPDELLEVGRWTLMLSLENITLGPQAGRLPSHVRDVEAHATGVHTVEYRILTPQSLPILEALSQMEDGFMLHLDEALFVMNARVKSGYFRREEPDGIDKEWSDWDEKDLHRSTVTGLKPAIRTNVPMEPVISYI